MSTKGARSGVADDLRASGRRHQWLPCGFDESYFDDDQGIIPTIGEGAYFVDACGDRYLDALCVQSAGVIGHNHPRVIEAIRTQLSRMASNAAGMLPSDRSIELAERLSELSGHQLTRTFFLLSGYDANDAAIKLARQYWKNIGRAAKYKTIVRRHGYHGGTLPRTRPAGTTAIRTARSSRCRAGLCMSSRHMNSSADSVEVPDHARWPAPRTSAARWSTRTPRASRACSQSRRWASRASFHLRQAISRAFARSATSTTCC